MKTKFKIYGLLYDKEKGEKMLFFYLSTLYYFYRESQNDGLPTGLFACISQKSQSKQLSVSLKYTMYCYTNVLIKSWAIQVSIKRKKS